MSSRLSLRADANCGWCYVNVDTGTMQWHAPSGSIPYVHTPLLEKVFTSTPPEVDRKTCYATLSLWSPWTPLYADVAGVIKLWHRRTGSVRLAPWISLRTGAGTVYFANVSTQETRWFPPRGWMSGWTARTQMDKNFYGTSYEIPAIQSSDRDRWPMHIARLMTEGGAPYLYDGHGVPEYPCDEFDTAHTYPM